MREIEWKVLSALMKNAKISDRTLGKKIGVSQPTVTRVRKNLENKGYIQEYTVIPNFSKIGYEIMAVTLVKLRKTLTQEQVQAARKLSRSLAKKSDKTGPFNVVMAERGIGLGYNGIFVSFHEDYGSFLKHEEWLKRFAFFDIGEIQSFLVNLHDELRYLPLTLSNLANHVLLMKDVKKKE